LLENKLPSEYFGQIQMSLYITGFKYWAFVSYCPGLKTLVHSVDRDEKYIKVLAVELNTFCDQLKAIVENIK